MTGLAEIFVYRVPVDLELETATAMILKARDRGWRVAVESGSGREILERLSDVLWTRGDGSFHAHGFDGDGDEDLHPILLTESSACGLDVEIRVYVGGALFPSDVGFYSRHRRIAALSDEGDSESFDVLLSRLSSARASGCVAKSFRRLPDGGWSEFSLEGG